MNNLILRPDNRQYVLLVDYVATTILWTLFALFIFLFAIDLLTGYYWQKRGQKPTSALFFCWQWRMPSLIVWALYNKLRFKNSIMQHTNIRRKNMQRASNTR